jgi:hypothetical protein
VVVIVLMIRIVVRMRMAVPRAVGVLVFMSMERDAQSPIESGGNAQQR